MFVKLTNSSGIVSRQLITTVVQTERNIRLDRFPSSEGITPDSWLEPLCQRIMQVRQIAQFWGNQTRQLVTVQSKLQSLGQEDCPVLQEIFRASVGCWTAKGSPWLEGLPRTGGISPVSWLLPRYRLSQIGKMHPALGGSIRLSLAGWRSACRILQIGKAFCKPLMNLRESSLTAWLICRDRPGNSAFLTGHPKPHRGRYRDLR